MSDWTWEYLDADGRAMTADALPATAFPTQGEAESWVGESWEELAEQGVDAVTLREDGGVVYGPMSLKPAE